MANNSNLEKIMMMRKSSPLHSSHLLIKIIIIRIEIRIRIIRTMIRIIIITRIHPSIHQQSNMNKGANKLSGNHMSRKITVQSNAFRSPKDRVKSTVVSASIVQ